MNEAVSEVLDGETLDREPSGVPPTPYVPPDEDAPPTPYVPPEEPEEKQPDAVLILKVPAPDGGISTDVVPLGDVQATEVQTLIELGLASWRAKIGL